MITIQGKGVSTGVALGPLYFYQRAKSTVTRYEVADTEAEWARFKAAQEKANAAIRQSARDAVIALKADLLAKLNAVVDAVKSIIPGALLDSILLKGRLKI